MPNRAKGKLASAVKVPGDPKTFSPQARDSQSVTAWDQLDRITRSGISSHNDADAEQLIALARGSIRARRIRKSSLPQEMFGEPAWDMLLSLYVGSRSGARQTVSNLGLSSGSSPTTALRWIDYLESQSLVARRASPTDRRVTYIDLTDSGLAAVEEYFEKLLAEGMIVVPS